MLYSFERTKILERFSVVVARGILASQAVGEWLSLVEHLVRDQGVGGSNPLSPTNSFQPLAIACEIAGS